MRRDWPGFHGVRPPIATSSCHAPKKLMAKATLRTPAPHMHVDAAVRDPALLAEVARLYRLLEIEGRTHGMGSNGHSRRHASAAYLALEEQIREVAGRYWRSPAR